ncbi:hypothetical protein HK101_005460 [Irineochytrium annulatum]|nr:hypothetical protein HK101_005460 [Irineochytrium annulatum]
MFKLLVATLLATVAAASPLSAVAPKAVDALSGFKVCGSGNTLTLTSLSYTPSEATPGQPLTVTLTGDLSKDVMQGTKITVKATYLGFITVLNDTADFCSAAGVTCPVQAGNNESLTFSFNIPSSAPKGLKVAVTATAINADGSEIICVTDPSFIV